jgi:N-acetylneuraminate synthase
MTMTSAAMTRSLEINGRTVGPGHPTYVVAEISANHRQQFEEAVRLLETAKAVGADAVKVQTYTPDTLTIPSDHEPFRITSGTLWDGRTLYELYRGAFMPWEWQPKLQAMARELGIEFFSTAYDASAVEFLEGLGVPVHKVASFELVDTPLIERMARTGKPLILSTGMATLEEIREAVHVATAAGATQLALLKCTSAYPAPPEEMHLRTLAHLAETFQVPVGLSDHTLGTAVPVAAVALGACIIEKHFTLSRAIPSADCAFSLEPDEFRAMVDAIRTAERSLGEVRYGAGEQEARSRVFRRSLFVVKPVKAGEPLTVHNVRSIRPGHGLPPKHLQTVLGRKAAQDIPSGTPLTWDLMEDAVR